jgi:hypothetical protein
MNLQLWPFQCDAGIPARPWPQPGRALPARLSALFLRSLLLFAVLGWFESSAFARNSFTRLKTDEQIVLYPAVGYRTPGTDTWRFEIRGCVFEPERRGLTLAGLREALDLKDIELTPPEQQTFEDRVRRFLVDRERGKKVFVRIGEQTYDMGKSSADGHFAGEIALKESEVRRLRRATGDEPGRILAAAELTPGDARRFTGEVRLLEDTGLSVISDIDDTIKITEVRDRRAMLRNTFLRPFQPAPDMPELYRSLAGSPGAEFHYVSASPWQLYPPLAEFIRTNGFPSGTFALKKFRLKDRSFLSLFADPEKYKPGVIEPLLKRFPNRRFVLIGDSGERDPEIYAALARRYPQQIERIWIRDVTGEPAVAERYRNVFRNLPGDLWQVFQSPTELKPLPPSPTRVP